MAGQQQQGGRDELTGLDVFGESVSFEAEKAPQCGLQFALLSERLRHTIIRKYHGPLGLFQVWHYKSVLHTKSQTNFEIS